MSKLNGKTKSTKKSSKLNVKTHLYQGNFTRPPRILYAVIFIIERMKNVIQGLLLKDCTAYEDSVRLQTCITHTPDIAKPPYTVPALISSMVKASRQQLELEII